MSTYLDLCQLLAREADYPNPLEITSVPAGTQLDGDQRDIILWVRDAWTAIQNRNGGFWKWLHRPFTLQTVSAQGVYAYTEADDITGNTQPIGVPISTPQGVPAAPGKIDRFSAWDLRDIVNPPSIYLTASGVSAERQLVFMPYDLFQRQFEFGPQNDASPVYISVDEQDNIVLGPAPNDIYTVRGRYWRGPQILVEGNDMPEMPVQFHDVVAYDALRRFAYKNAAPEALGNAAEQSKRYIRSLEAKQYSEFRFAAPMGSG